MFSKTSFTSYWQMATHPSPLHCTFILHITIDFLSLVCFALLSFSVATWCIIHQPRHKVLFSNSNQSSVSHWAPEILIGGSVAAQVLSDSKLTKRRYKSRQSIYRHVDSFVQELGIKQWFLACTNMDYLTSEWRGTPNFKVDANFDVFYRNYGSKSSK